MIFKCFKVLLYRVIQELSNNVIEHASATVLNIILQKTNRTIKVEIADNGIGFDYETVVKKDRLALKNILIRVAYLKGKVRFTPNKPSCKKLQSNSSRIKKYYI